MRVELRVELDEHEYGIEILCDQSVPHHVALNTAQTAMVRLLSPMGILVSEECIR